ncbi:Gfo/Idh/MocA family protein [Pseudochryseolinea flava]|uniref:Gfo/Idh/MocA family oxidoreductase n=1 Tax=Pseudochryseolinea flava TaxID=2059302 RepID=A0A364XWH7_9BACT|nr:Gfo/Idh/MocA family oxidoreductase [Pseudochryseolinea flava]RAV98564.1 gfo/Idh/MocA family oxidoreductase [Pseudochryseolinea flava]
MKKINWGILGAGKIANKFANDLKLVEDATLVAVASRDDAKGNEFAAQYGIPVVFNTYEALASSPEIDVIYVATPHSFHREHTLLCLNHGKAVLCEKAFALNSREVSDMVRVAREKKIFLMEAFWTKFLPQFDKVRQLIAEDAIGDIRWIQADFGFISDPPAPRLFDPGLGGGSLLDIGIYPVFLAQTLLGVPKHVQATIVPFSSGVDQQCSITFTYDNGAMASLFSTLTADTPVEAVIAGTKGRIEMRNRFHNAVGKLFLIGDKDEPKEIEVYRESGYGYQFEARHVTACLQKGLTESPIMTLDDSIQLIKTLDNIRRVAGIKYSVD